MHMTYQWQSRWYLLEIQPVFSLIVPNVASFTNPLFAHLKQLRKVWPGAADGQRPARSTSLRSPCWPFPFGDPPPETPVLLLFA